MKKILTFLTFTSFSGLFAQITITSNLPSNIVANATVDVDVKINKGTVGNFAKYQMDAPIGYIITSVDAKGGNFTFENQRAKIVWVSIPSDAEVLVKFKVQSSSASVSPGTFSQKFYYLENNEKKEVEGTPVTVTIDGGGIAVAATPAETKPVETVVTTPTETKPVETVVATPTETKPVETVVATPTENKPVETVVTKIEVKNTTATTETGMTFRVQLGAFSVEPSKSKFASAGKVSVDLIDGKYKVTTGNFTSKDDAIKLRDALLAKGYSGFIAKYKDGKRIN